MSEATTFDELLKKCEKDPEFRKAYLQTALDETAMAYIENNFLRKERDKLVNKVTNLQGKLEKAKVILQKAQDIPYLVDGAIDLSYKAKVGRVIFEALTELDIKNGGTQ